MAEGVVKKFFSERGFGFLTPDGESTDVFVHFSQIEGEGFRNLVEGQRVEFDVAAGKKGQEAQNVRVI